MFTLQTNLITATGITSKRPLTLLKHEVTLQSLLLLKAASTLCILNIRTTDTCQKKRLEVEILGRLGGQIILEGMLALKPCKKNKQKNHLYHCMWSSLLLFCLFLQ